MCLRLSLLVLAGLIFVAQPVGALPQEGMAEAGAPSASRVDRSGSKVGAGGAVRASRAHPQPPRRDSTGGNRPVATGTVDSTQHPNEVPYRTHRSVAYHVLAFPSYVLDALTYPLGVTVRYLEANFPSLFRPKPVVRGVRPLIELGGPNGVEIGLALFHHDLWNAGHDVRLSGEVAARESWDLELQYRVPSPFGASTSLEFFSEYTVNDRRRFFLGGNDSDVDTDEAQFYTRRLETRARLGYPVGADASGHTELRYRHVRARPSDANPEEGERIVGQPGLGENDLIDVQTEIVWDGTRTHQRRRTYRRVGGTVLIGRLGYTQGITSDRFRYGTAVGEIQQYVPLPFLPPARRLALRARVEKNEPLFGGEAIPFYDLRGLGGQESLRGFRFDRFVDDGLLLLNAEYRYPVWDALDAVIFVDAGQAFSRFSDVAADRFRWSYGGGLRLLSGRKLAGRFEVANSVDGVRVLLTVTPTFGSRPVGD